MVTRPGPYEQFGNYSLFKKLEEDALGDLWRAAPLDNSGAPVAIRRLIGGNRATFALAVAAAAVRFPQLTGSTFVKAQRSGVVNGVPYLVHEYVTGRTLRHVIDRARGGASAHVNPLPTEQAVAIAERLAASLEATFNVKNESSRLTHGALIPHFVWLGDDGDVRVGGQGLAHAFMVSMSVSEFAEELSRYFAPEMLESGKSTRESEVFSVGALLFLMLTGEEPPPTARAAAAIEHARLMTGSDPIPADLKQVLARSFQTNPAQRFPNVAEMRSELSTLIHGGRYAPTTFNLAFYINNLLKKEFEAEILDREREAKVTAASQPPLFVAASMEAPTTAPAVSAAPEPPPERARRMAALVIAALVVILGIGSFFVWRGQQRPAAAPLVTASNPSSAPPAAASPVIAEPIVAAGPTGDPAAGAPLPSEEERKKAFETEVNRRLQKEMLKLQSDADRNARLSEPPPRPASTPVANSAPPAATRPDPEKGAPSASSLDQTRLQQTRPEALPEITRPAPDSTVTTTPSSTTIAESREVVREGDLVPILSVDEPPKRIRVTAPVYPPIALRQKAEATLILSALVSETGRVIDVKFLRGDSRGLGLNEAAERAVRSCQFTPAIKDGKRVKTWTPVPITFKVR